MIGVIRLRWLAICGVAVVLAVSGPVLGVLPPGSAPTLWTVLAALTAYNTALGWLGPDRGWPWLTRLAGQIVVDCLALASLVHFAGGAENPFIGLFVLHVVNANIVLRPRAASQILLLAIGLTAVIVLGEGTGLIAHHCLRQDGSCWGATLSVPSLAVLAATVLTLIASAFLARHLTARLQDSERRLTAAVHDLSHEKQHLAETQTLIDLERSRLQSVMDCIADAVTFSDLDGRLRLANQRAREIQRIAGPLADRVPTNPEALSRLLGSSGDGETASTLPRYERGGRTFEATLALVRDARGQPIGTVTVERDISDRLVLERHLMHEERMAVVGKLAATVAHEINNPIGVVSLYAQHALAQLPAGDPIRGHLDVIRRNAESCRKIIGNLLGLARTRQPEQRSVDLRDLCRDVVRSVEPMAAGHGVRLTDARAPGDAAPLWVQGDADQLYQAILNLAVNAIEACSDGDLVTLRSGTAIADGAASHVIEVRDSGPGVPTDQRERIFQPFYSTKPAGTGLGLAVADNIVKNHGGRITSESAVPHGMVFRIHLPPAARAPIATNDGDARAPDAAI